MLHKIVAVFGLKSGNTGRHADKLKANTPAYHKRICKQLFGIAVKKESGFARKIAAKLITQKQICK